MIVEIHFGTCLSGFNLPGRINLTIGLITFRFARDFNYYSDLWDLRLDTAGKGEESLKQTLENR